MALIPVGIDVSKDTLDVAALVPGKATPLRRKLPNTPAGHSELVHWLATKHLGTVHACLEATGGYEEGAATALHQAGHTVSIINPAGSANYARSRLTRAITDRTSAELLARYCDKENPPPWQPPRPEVRLLRDLVRRRADLVTMRAQEKNRLHAPGLAAPIAGSLREHIAALDAQITDLDRQIADQIENDPELKRQHDLLVSIPGVATLSAALLLGEWEDPMRYPDARAVGVDAGLTSRRHVSGTSVRARERISKMGNGHIRAGMFYPTKSAIAWNPVIRPFFDRLIAQKKPYPVAVCASMRKLLHIAWGVLHSGLPFDPRLATATS